MTIFNIDPNTQIVADFGHFIIIGVHTEGTVTTIKFAKIYLYGKIEDFDALATSQQDANIFIQGSSIKGSVEYLLTAATSVEYVTSICDTMEIFGIRIYFKIFDELTCENVNTTLLCTGYESILAQLSLIEQNTNAANSLISPYLAAQLQMNRFTL